MSEPTLSLHVLTGQRKGERIDIGTKGALLGRLDECEVTLRDGTVSSHHARLAHVGGQWTVEDLNSTNHTLLNGERVLPGRVTTLPSRGRLTVGDVGISFEVLRPSAADRPGPRRLEGGDAWSQDYQHLQSRHEQVQAENRQLQARCLALETALEQARAERASPAGASAGAVSSGSSAQSLQMMEAFGESLDQLSGALKRLKKQYPEAADVEEARARARDCIMKMADLSSLLRSGG